jgi:ribulose kinase
MNAKGHHISSIYMSGSQAKNGPLMRLLATVLNMPVIIPPQPSAAVVLGAAMLGRFAHDLNDVRQDSDYANNQGGKLWEVMSEMTQPGVEVLPRSDDLAGRERKLLEAKYKIFREAVEVQLKWRKMVAEAVA